MTNKTNTSGIQTTNWRVERRNDGHPIAYSILATRSSDGQTGWIADIQDEATARLMAAAPDLLAALKYCLASGEDADWSVVRAAIAKAEGPAQPPRPIQVGDTVTCNLADGRTFVVARIDEGFAYFVGGGYWRAGRLRRVEGK